MVMKNPLNRRIVRDLKKDFSKYLIVFVMLVLCISAGFAFILADKSISITFEESFEKYNIEDGYFTLKNKMNKAQKKIIEESGVSIYDNSYVNETRGIQTIRIYNANYREKIDGVDYMTGTRPTSLNEIGIDRMYAQNNDISVGDEFITDGRTYTVTSLISLSDYACLYESNDDVMFDSINFGVAVVSDETFNTYSKKEITNCYSWIYDEKTDDEVTLKTKGEDLLKVINSYASLDSFVPEYTNQSIAFVLEDLVSDYGSMIFFLYVLLIILAYINAITISNTIDNESKVIGTLRATGYTRKELLHHYMALPTIITFIGTLIGYLLGNTVLKTAMLKMYYGSYSLLSYEDHYVAEVFILALILPVTIMIGINYLVLKSKLKISPLKFLRRDLSGKKKSNAFPLSKKIRFITRFKLRVLLQNKASYVTLFFGIFLACFIMLFGLGFPEMLDNYASIATSEMDANYTYMLSIPSSIQDDSDKLKSTISLLNFSRETETDNDTAEKFSAYVLTTEDDFIHEDNVTIYGIEKDSDYINIDLNYGDVYITSGFADKYQIGIGDSITLKEQYEDKEYTFTIDGIYDKECQVNMYMDKDYLNDFFDLGNSYFCGYFSDSPIEDIDEKYLGSVIDEKTMTSLSDQLTVSMGGFMSIMKIFSIVVFFVLIYLLSKTIIERNARNISLLKIVGYSNKETNRIYVRITTYVVIFSLLVSIPILYYFVMWVFEMLLRNMLSGWVPLVVSNKTFAMCAILGFVTYLVVSVFEYIKISRIPMSDALKIDE